MRALGADRFDRWIRGTAILALVILGWALFLPDGLYWTALLAAGLTGAAVAAAAGLLVGSRGVPSLTQVVARTDAGPVAVPAGCEYTGRAENRPRGERKP